MEADGVVMVLGQFDVIALKFVDSIERATCLCIPNEFSAFLVDVFNGGSVLLELGVFRRQLVQLALKLFRTQLFGSAQTVDGCLDTVKPLELMRIWDCKVIFSPKCTSSSYCDL